MSEERKTASMLNTGFWIAFAITIIVAVSDLIVTGLVIRAGDMQIGVLFVGLCAARLVLLLISAFLSRIKGLVALGIYHALYVVFLNLAVRT